MEASGDHGRWQVVADEFVEDREFVEDKPPMNPPNALRSATSGIDQGPAVGAEANDEWKPHYGKVHAVPASDVVASSGWLTEALYRGFEIVVALIGLTVGLPVMLIVAIMIRCDSSGPALFVQRRVARSIVMRGRDLEGRTDLVPPPGGYEPDTLYFVPSFFTLLKFRTMHSDARTRFPQTYAYQFGPGEFHRQYATPRIDPRVTRVGAVMRKLSVDELPNLWSILVGDIRLVGPRPEILEVIQYYTPEEMYKFACKPGITGLAQINGRGFLNWGETLAWDLQYLRTRSVAGDLKIILQTLKSVVTRRGAF